MTWDRFYTTNTSWDDTITYSNLEEKINEVLNMNKCNCNTNCKKCDENKEPNKKMSKPYKNKIPKIKNIDFQPPLTVVIWDDGTKTFVKCLENDDFDPEKGAAMAIAKKALGDNYHYNDVINYYTEKYYKKHPKNSCENSAIGKLSTAEADIIWLIRKCGADAEDFVYDILLDAYQSM